MSRKDDDRGGAGPWVSVFQGFGCGPPDDERYGMRDPHELGIFWPGWRRFAAAHDGLPPLEDATVEVAVEKGTVEGQAPAWLCDGLAAVRAFGGRGWPLEPEVLVHGAGVLLGSVVRHVPQWNEHESYVVMKPRWNPNGLAEGARLVLFVTPAATREPTGFPVLPLSLTRGCGMIVQPYYLGAEVCSVDCAVVNGRVRWGITSRGQLHSDWRHRFGQFRGWRVEASPGFRISGAIGTDVSWVQPHVDRYLPRYTGVVNIEYVMPDERMRPGEAAGNSRPIVDVHFRPSVEHFPLYGEEAVRAIVAVAAGQPGLWADTAPEVTGGEVLVIPKDVQRIQCLADLGEDSWRYMVAYLPE